MKRHGMKSEQGFTLIEAMITLVIISVGLLALGSLTVSVMRSDANAKARTMATHLAEQMLEEWSATGALATFGVVMPATPTDVATMNTSAAALYTSTDINVTYTLTASVSRMVADIPGGTSNSTVPPGPSGAATAGMLNSDATTPVEKKVTVSWSNGGQTYTVYLTHATVKP